VADFGMSWRGVKEGDYSRGERGRVRKGGDITGKEKTWHLKGVPSRRYL